MIPSFAPFDLQTVFSSARARTDAAQWALILQGRAHVELSLFKDHDAVCGLPASGAAERLLAEIPAYTKVILAVEPDKAQGAATYTASLCVVRLEVTRFSSCPVNFFSAPRRRCL